MKTALLGAVACGAWAMGTSGAAADAPKLFVDRAVGSDISYCPPCMAAWVTGVRPNSKVVLRIIDSGAPGPSSLKVAECGAGLGFAPFVGSGKGDIDLVATVDGIDTGPFHCSGPFQPGPTDCPPPPALGVISIPFGQAIVVPVATGDPLAGFTLHRLLTGDKPGWEPVDVPGHFAPRPIPRVTFKEPVDPGVYRVQVLNKERKVLEVHLVRVEEKTGKPPLKPGRKPAPKKVH